MPSGQNGGEGGGAYIISPWKSLGMHLEVPDILLPDVGDQPMTFGRPSRRLPRGASVSGVAPQSHPYETKKH